MTDYSPLSLTSSPHFLTITSPCFPFSSSSLSSSSPSSSPSSPPSFFSSLLFYLSSCLSGIGLCRTEHMFFAPERIGLMRSMILSEVTIAIWIKSISNILQWPLRINASSSFVKLLTLYAFPLFLSVIPRSQPTFYQCQSHPSNYFSLQNIDERRSFLNEMLPLQREDFKNIFRSCNGRQVISLSILSHCPLLSFLLLCLWDVQDNDREKKTEESLIKMKVTKVLTLWYLLIYPTFHWDRISRDAVLVSRWYKLS